MPVQFVLYAFDSVKTMVQYTLAQCPEVTLSVAGKDSKKAREKAMDQLIELMDEGKLPVDLSDGFSPQQLIEVKTQDTDMAADEEESVVQAVQTLNNLANLKLKAQELRDEALKVRDQIDILFTDDPVTEEEISHLKDGFKALKNFAQANIRYRVGRTEAEHARVVLDEALKTSEK